MQARDNTEPSTEALVEIRRETALAIRRVEHAMDETHSFNTAISGLMKLSNVLRGHVEACGSHADFKDAMKALCTMLAPMAPHHACHIYSEIFSDSTDTVFDQSWPHVDESDLVVETVTLAVQIKGKVRGQISVIPDADKTSILEAIKAEPRISKWLTSDVARIIRPPKGNVVSLVLAN
eukprot:TRINITY_DN9575_c0_g1_i1.p2 TRINITY_DN9575_c0_g1~~TRINITY_DN9575_c0_g1_i1.p2  ORF type:complete len:179 (+),score=15.40 TRINITY_DN9575_c0_g1_i1:2154-2690(+)